MRRYLYLNQQGYLGCSHAHTIQLSHLHIDTFTNLTRIDGDESSTPPINSTFLWSEKNIAWPGEARKYVTKPGYAAADIVPPPFWIERFPDGYTDDNLPDLKSDEHFQNWMRTAGLPTFSKLWGRHDDEALSPGRYEITINLSECSCAGLGGAV